MEASATSRPGAIAEGGRAEGVPFQEIAFSGVRYSYGDERDEALRGVSFRIRRGERVALVGPTGAGKSTVAALLLRFMDPQAGALTVDGSLLANTPPEDWRRMVAWVPQAPYLFRGTVADNIRLARPDAPDEELFRAAEQAGLHEDILSLPRGYETEIGERGARLSGGQAQRIALARAFLKDAPILILDEAAAHLDPEHEALVQESLDRLMEGRTTLAIAHRLGTARRSDRVIVLSDGEVLEEGSHAELMAARGLYSRMVHAGGEPGAQHGGDRGPTAIPAETRGRGADGPALKEGNNPLITHDSPLISRPSSPVFIRLLGLVAPLWPRIALATLLGAATVGSGVGLMATASYLIARAALHPSVAELSLAIVGVRFFGISRGVFRYLERYVSHQLTFRLLSRLRVWFYEALEPLAPARLVDYREGDLLNRIVADVDALQHFYVRVLAPPLVGALATLLMGAFMASFHPAPALVLVAFMVLAGIGGPLLCRRLARGPGRAMAGTRAELASCLVESIQGMADLVAYGRQEDRLELVEALSSRWIRAQKRMSWITGIQAALGVWLPGMGMVAVMAVSIPLITQGTLEGIYLAVLAMAALAGFEAVAYLPSAFQQLEVSLESGRRLFEIVDTEPAVPETRGAGNGRAPFRSDEDGPGPGGRASRRAEPISAGQAARRLKPAATGNLHLGEGDSPLAPHIRIEGLGFRYGPYEPWALRGISLEIPPGGRVALVGASGAGKSTLISLLPRFWEYQEGAVTLDGRDLRGYRPEEVREIMAVVSQRSHLFSGTLRDNLLLARPEADEEEILQALECGGLAPLVKSLPRGLEERIGERGLKLSGGERQRLAIARAFLRKAPVLLMDEPTANLDNLASRRLMAGILEPARSRSVLVVTHRLAGVVEDTDQILVMSGGRIVERGRHGELLSCQGLYHRMWELERLSLFPEEEETAAPVRPASAWA